MSRKKTTKLQLKGVNLPLELWQKVEKQKAKTGVPIKRFIVDAVNEKLAR